MNRFLCLVLLCTQCIHGFSPYRRVQELEVIGTDHGSPLFLTKYIENDDIESARNASMVPPFVDDIESYSGYFTVDKRYNSNLFFWFFPAERYATHAPVVVWLQGGPGASSLSGLFTENGPLFLNKNGKISQRKHHWSQIANVIYIDNPVGTGFSFTEDDDGYAKNEDQVGENLYEAISQFFKVFPEYVNNEFYVTGESYAGKYVPAMAYTIHQRNQMGYQKINLKGIAIGNGLVDPVNMMDYGNYLNNIGLIDEAAKQVFNNVENDIINAIESEQYDVAFDKFDLLLNGDLTTAKSLFYNKTGFNFYFNYLHTEDDSPDGNMEQFLQYDFNRKKIHVGNLTFNSGQKVELHLKEDVMKSMKPWFQALMENYRVLVYNGQLDIIVAYPLTVNFLKTVEWSGAEEYKSAKRKLWKVDNQIAGYSKTVGTFTEVLVRNAGHMVPSDQPYWALDLIKRFIFNEGF